MTQLTIVVGGDVGGRSVTRASRGPLTGGGLAERPARVVELRWEGGPTLLAETREAGWDTPWGSFALVGGHRLWRSPQEVPGADAPDTPVEVTALADGLC